MNAPKNTWVKILSERKGAPIGEAFVYKSTGTDIPVVPTLVEGDKISAQATLCGESTISEKVEVGEKTAPSMPTVAPSHEHDEAVRVTNTTPGSLVDVYVNDIWRGSKFCAQNKVIVPISLPLQLEQKITARQSLCTRTSPFSAEVVVTVPPPVAAFSVDKDTIDEGEAVTFTDTSTGVINSREWDFGDGNSSNNTNPTHIHDEAGEFTAELTVSNDGGESKATRNIVVNEEPIQGPSKVAIFNCQTDGFKIHVWVRDVTASSWWEEKDSGDSHWDRSCTKIDPLVIDLEDGHTYMFKILIPEHPDCIAGNDPLGDSPCLAEGPRSYLGDEDGGTEEWIVY